MIVQGGGGWWWGGRRWYRWQRWLWGRAWSRALEVWASRGVSRWNKVCCCFFLSPLLSKIILSQEGMSHRRSMDKCCMCWYKIESKSWWFTFERTIAIVGMSWPRLAMLIKSELWAPGRLSLLALSTLECESVKLKVWKWKCEYLEDWVSWHCQLFTTLVKLHQNLVIPVLVILSIKSLISQTTKRFFQSSINSILTKSTIVIVVAEKYHL